MIEDDRAIDRRAGRSAGAGARRAGGMPVEQRRRLVRQVADEPTGQRGQPLDARTAQSIGERDEGLRGVRRRRGVVEPEIARDVRDPDASPSPITTAAGSPATNEYRPHRSDRSTLSSRTPGPVARERGEHARPASRRRRAARSRPARAGTSTASVSNVARSGWILMGAPLPRRRSRETTNPGTSPGASWFGSDAERTRARGVRLPRARTSDRRGSFTRPMVAPVRARRQRSHAGGCLDALRFAARVRDLDGRGRNVLRRSIAMLAARGDRWSRCSGRGVHGARERGRERPAPRA